MKSLLAVLVIVAFAAVGHSNDEGGPAVKPVRRDAPFRAYWLDKTDDGKPSEYLHLLITHGPLEDLAGHQAWSHHPLDNMAMTFRTYRRDSLWDAPFVGVKLFGTIDAKSKTAVVDGASYQYESCPLADVVTLLEKPTGSRPISRRSDPLEGAKQTSKAFHLLLKDQLKVVPADN